MNNVWHKINGFDNCNYAVQWGLLKNIFWDPFLCLKIYLNCLFGKSTCTLKYLNKCRIFWFSSTGKYQVLDIFHFDQITNTNTLFDPNPVYVSSQQSFLPIIKWYHGLSRHIDIFYKIYKYIVPAQSQFAVVTGVCYFSCGANQFQCEIHVWVISALATAMGAQVHADSAGPALNLASRSWGNSLIIGIYLAASVLSHIFKSVSGVSNQVSLMAGLWRVIQVCSTPVGMVHCTYLITTGVTPHLYNRGSSMQVNYLHSEANDMLLHQWCTDFLD